jgi:ABC-type branched-subunit amino acid transport system ATPase component
VGAPAGGPGGALDAPPELVVDHVSVRFGVKSAVDDVSFGVAPGSVVGLIGPNGAGKTTLLNAISGLQPATGRLLVDGVDIGGWSPDRRARHGLGRSFQDARLFPTMTVRDAVRTAAATHERPSVVLDALVPGPSRRAERRVAGRAEAVLELTGLGRYADERCAVLSTGTRRVVEIACLIAGGGRLLLLDEPTAGLAQREVEAFPPILRALRDHLDATVVIVEHDIVMLASVCDRLVCMEAGRVIADGPPDAVRHDPAVVESYLGPDLVAVERTGAAT